MRKKMLKMLVLLFISLLAAGLALAQEDAGEKDSGDLKIPEQVTNEHWAYKEIAELGEKYEADKKLPEGRPCSKSELAGCFLAILDKVVERYEKEGAHAILRDDVERIAALHEALESELVKIDGYRTRRKTIKEILVLIEPEAVEDRWKVDGGGQIRLRGDFARNQNFTDFTFTPGQKEAQFLERTRLHGSIENPALGLKVFVQPQWYGRWGGIDRRSEIDLYQGYVEWDKILGSPFSLKAGRQDFSYGSTFFLGPNDFYNGLSWDGVKMNLNLRKDFSVDILGVKMAKLNSGDPNIYLTGLYSTYRLDKENSLEGYLFYNKGGFPFLHREFEVTDSGQKWFTLGVRFAGKMGGFDYELEPQFQWGKVKNPLTDERDKVRAYGGHIDLGYTFKLPWEPRLFAAFALGSGDNDPFDGKVNQFHGNIYNDNYLVGDMSVITDLSGVTVGGTHASGIRVLVGGISINPLSNLNLNLDFHRFSANKVPSGFSKDLGVEVNLVASYKVTKGISSLVGLNRFFTGRFFEQASGSKKNINYGYIQVQLEF